jgi:hypothetical protein
MNKVILIWLEVIFIVIIICFAQGAQSAQPQDQDIDHWIKQLQDRDWRVREDAFSKLALLPPKLKTDKVKKALINELANELEKIETNNIEACPDNDCGEGGEEGYFNSLMETVAELHDERALPLFIKIGSPTFLVKFGDKGVNIILQNLDTKTKCGERLASVKILSEVLRQDKHGYVAQGSIRQGIKKIMINTLEQSQNPDKNIEWYKQRATECANVRIYIVRAFGSFAESGDEDVVPIIKSIAEKDSYDRANLSNKPNDQRAGNKYIVREEAQKILENLKNNNPGTTQK